MKFLDMVSMLLPFLDPLISQDKEGAVLFLKMRCASTVLKAVIRAPIYVNQWANVCWYILILGLQRALPVRYIIARRIHRSDGVEEQTKWIQARFTDCVDSYGNSIPSNIMKPARPVPKCKPQKPSQLLTLMFYAIQNIFELQVYSDETVEEVKAKIMTKYNIRVSGLYLHGPYTLLQLDDFYQLHEYDVENGDALTIFVAQRQWEDSSDDEKTHCPASSSDSSNIAQQVQDIIDGESLRELQDKYNTARVNCLVALNELRQFKKTHPRISKKCSLTG
jgi:hypothetical protein